MKLACVWEEDGLVDLVIDFPLESSHWVRVQLDNNFLSRHQTYETPGVGKADHDRILRDPLWPGLAGWKKQEASNCDARENFEVRNEPGF